MGVLDPQGTLVAQNRPITTSDASPAWVPLASNVRAAPATGSGRCPREATGSLLPRLRARQLLGFRSQASDSHDIRAPSAREPVTIAGSDFNVRLSRTYS